MTITPLITLTDAALLHIKNMMKKNKNAIGFRLSIKKTGCSGYAYVPDIAETVKADDIYFMWDDLAIYVDAESAAILKGLNIDYQAENKGLKQKRLVFHNPNEANRCGCGESFTIE